MKFSRVLVLYLSLMVAPSALAAPLWHGGRCSPGSADVRCIGHEDDHGRIPDSHSSARGVMREIPHRPIPLYLAPNRALSD